MPKGKSSLDPAISRDSINIGRRFAGASKDPKTLSLLDACGTAALYLRRLAPRVPAINVVPPSTLASPTMDNPNMQRIKPHAVELPAPNPTLHSPNPKFEVRPCSSISVAGIKAEVDTDKHYSVPRIVTACSTEVDPKPKSKDTDLMNARTEEPAPKAEDEEWGIVSSVWMESMDGD